MIETEIVKDLVNYLEGHPDAGEAFNEAFSKASASGILKKYDILSLADYIVFIDGLFKWIPSAKTPTHVHEQFCLFYYILDLSPVVDLQLASASVEWYTWFSQWIIKYSEQIIKYMDTPKSINDAAVATFYKSANYHMEDYLVPPGGWKSINDFFARRIDPSVRPIAEPDNDYAIVSPADGSYSGCWDISSNGTVDISFMGLPWDLSVLFQNEEYAQHFKDGHFIHLSVDCHDYHRQHAPVCGVVKDAKVIPGICYLGVDVAQNEAGEPQFIARRRLMNSGRGFEGKDACKGYQIQQPRGLVLIDSPIFGLVCVLVVGIGQTSPVSLAVKARDEIQKGQEISSCRMGGCDVFVFFQKSPGIGSSFPDSDFPSCSFKMGQAISIA